jgi:hypothetical protein
MNKNNEKYFKIILFIKKIFNNILLIYSLKVTNIMHIVK